MKKLGFTLAEVLITLAIIGVIATLTLPALMTNTAEQQYKAGLKKGLNTLTEAAQANGAQAGFDYGSVTQASTDMTDEDQSIWGLLANRTNMDRKLSGTANVTSDKLGVVAGQSGNAAVFFRDGSAIIFKLSDLIDDTTGALQPDGLPKGIAAIYDTNGLKGPNLVSNCDGKIVQTSALSDAEKDCSQKDKRVIRDQFGIKLRGGFAVPNGAASRWILTDDK